MPCKDKQKNALYQAKHRAKRKMEGYVLRYVPKNYSTKRIGLKLKSWNSPLKRLRK